MAKRHTPEPDGEFIREGIVSNPHETSYAVWLSESDVVALKAGVVTPYMQQYAGRLLAMLDEVPVEKKATA